MNKTQLIASLTIDYHRIEKGLSMQNVQILEKQKYQVIIQYDKYIY